VVYLAEHPALAVLEVRVHLDLDLDLLPDDYVLLRVALPEASEALDAIPPDPSAAGNRWLAAAAAPVLRVPSVLAPWSFNLLLNPRHADARQARIEASEPFRFDSRLR